MLINGGGGGSGSFAIQLAKRAGAHVTACDNAGKLDFMRSLGADEVIDYRRDDFTRDAARTTSILDLVAHRSVFAYRRALARGGRYRCVGGSVRALLRVLTVGSRRRPAHGPPDRASWPSSTGPPTSSRSPSCASPARSASTSTARSRCDEVPEALAHVGEGRALGKVVVEPR